MGSRPRESSAGCSALNGPTYATYTTDTCTPPQLLHLFYDSKAQIFKGRLAQVGAGAITAAEVEGSELWWVWRRIEVLVKWFHLLLSLCSPPIWWRRQSRRPEMDLFLSRFQCCCVVPIRPRLIQITGWLDLASNGHWQHPSPIIMKPSLKFRKI